MVKREGWECEEREDGSKSCRRFKAKRKGRFATGTEVELIPEPSNGCKVRVVGNVMDEDKKELDSEIKRIEDRCKRGF